jgi:uncharacterized membrane protein YhaH (DUF805 family)
MNIFTYKGRMRRRNYLLIIIPINLLLFILGELLENSVEPNLMIYFLVVMLFLSTLTVFQIIKRLHDIGRKGIYWLVIFVPVLNIGFALWLCYKDGEIGENKYGQDPKGRIAG